MQHDAEAEDEDHRANRVRYNPESQEAGDADFGCHA